MLKMKERNKGITLISLVITIIVLLILAAITISALSGENGILKQAQRARLENKRATVKEIIKIAETDEYIEHREESDRAILEATQEHLKNPKSPLYDQGKKVKVDENIYGENSGEIYFYVVVDDDIYKVTREDVEIIGQVNQENVELQKEEMKINQNPTIWTNDKVKITIVVNTDKIIDYAIKYKIHYKTVEEIETEKVTGDATEKVAQTSTERAATEEWQTYTNEFEVEKNCIIYAKLEGINGETAVVTGNVMRIDKLNPKEFIPEITEVTTNSITVKANTTDADATNEYGCSGVKQYRFREKNGEWSNYQDNGTYKFEDLSQKTNYTIEVEAKDEAGNTKVGTVTKQTESVPGLQTSSAGQTGNVTFTYNPTTDTSGNVKVTITQNIGKNGYTLQYRTSKDGQDGEKKDWTEYKGEITLGRNQNIYARLVDSTNQGGDFATGTIANIDKLPPNTFTPTTTAATTSIKVTANTSDQAQNNDYKSTGNIQYRFKKNSEQWSEYQSNGNYTFSGLAQNTEYTIYVEAKDNVGNTIEVSEKVRTLLATINLSQTSGKVLSGKSVTVNITGQNYGQLNCRSSDTNIATASISGTTLTVNGVSTANGTQTATITVTGSDGGSATYTIQSHKHWGDETSGTGCYTKENIGYTTCRGRLKAVKTGSYICNGTQEYRSVELLDGQWEWGRVTFFCWGCLRYYEHTYVRTAEGWFDKCGHERYEGSADDWTHPCGNEIKEVYYECEVCSTECVFSDDGEIHTNYLCGAKTKKYTYYTMNCGF